MPYHDGVPDLITLVLFALATARSVQLIKADKVTEGWRRWWLRRSPPGSLRAYWITCDWCISIACAGLWWAPLYATWAAPRPMPWLAWWAVATLAFSYLAVLLAAAQRMLDHKEGLMAILAAPPPEDVR